LGGGAVEVRTRGGRGIAPNSPRNAWWPFGARDAGSRGVPYQAAGQETHNAQTHTPCTAGGHSGGVVVAVAVTLHTHLQQLQPQLHKAWYCCILGVAVRHCPECCCCCGHVLAACGAPTRQQVVEGILHVAQAQLGVAGLLASRAAAVVGGGWDAAVAAAVVVGHNNHKHVGAQASGPPTVI
jgi:hypothetical protein